MTKEKQPYRVSHIGLEDSSPNTVATVNTKVVEGETTVFQQILSAGVDFITPDVLEFLAHKFEELINKHMTLSHISLNPRSRASSWTTLGKWNVRIAKDILRPVCALTLSWRH